MPIPGRRPPADKLNVSQWVSVAKSMGARVAALTSKHEKGFCLWPSKYSNFTIAHSPTVGHRDLVREFTDECRKQGEKRPPLLFFHF
jgi:alpha-L-fucosidase